MDVRGYDDYACVCVCVRPHVRACVRPYVHACVHTCVRAHVRACVSAYSREMASVDYWNFGATERPPLTKYPVG